MYELVVDPVWLFQKSHQYRMCVRDVVNVTSLRNDRSTVGAQLIRHSVVSNLISDRKLHKNSKS